MNGHLYILKSCPIPFPRKAIDETQWLSKPSFISSLDTHAPNLQTTAKPTQRTKNAKYQTPYNHWSLAASQCINEWSTDSSTLLHMQHQLGNRNIFYPNYP